MIITCPHCNARYALNKIPDRATQLKVSCKRCGNHFAIDLMAQKPNNYKIVVAHDDLRVINVIKRILSNNHFEVECAYDGATAFELIKKIRPNAAIIDVALPGIFGFELCEKIKNDPNLKDIKVVLVASIYDRTRYKRKPQNLYGADDYVEKHHIPDQLLPKLIKLLSGKELLQKTIEVTPPPIPKDLLKDNRELLLDERKIEKERAQIKEGEKDYLTAIPQVSERAKKLARLIVSDIALYNQEKINKLSYENFYDLLKLDIDDGIAHLSKKIPEVASKARELIFDAMKEIIDKYKKGVK